MKKLLSILILISIIISIVGCGTSKKNGVSNLGNEPSVKTAISAESNDTSEQIIGSDSSITTVAIDGVDVSSYTDAKKTRVINLVYDDSGSMIKVDDIFVDTWCQAKYAMEVFAAMLDTKDTLNVYVLSDFSKGTNSPPKIIMRGDEPAESRVAKIHNMITTASNTPYSSVEKAYSDIKTAIADEKWLVVLTDGEFDNMTSAQVDAKFSQYVAESKIKIMFLSMGATAAQITDNQGKGIYSEKAQTNDEIISKITGICNRLFERNSLIFSDTVTKQFTFDVPMQELMVFAQGENAKVTAIKGDNNKYKSISEVNVKYSETSATNYANNPNVIIARGLTGVVATFSSIPAGSYQLEVSGATTVEIYYKPDMTIGIKLFKGTEEVTSSEKLVGGDYRIEFGFVNDRGEFFESSLLGKVVYNATITNNGTVVKSNCKPGDTVTLEQGDATINVEAKFLDYNTVSAALTYKILKPPKPLDIITTLPTQKYVVSKLDDMTEGILATIKQEGNLLTKEQWDKMELPIITSTANLDFVVEKGKDVSTFVIFLKLKDGNKYQTSSGEIKIDIASEMLYDEQLSTGKTSMTINIKDDISPLDRLMDWLLKYGLRVLICLLIIIFILGYVKPFKKYFSKRLKKKPEVTATSRGAIPRENKNEGKFTKDLMSTLIPYKAETGTIRFVPPGVSDFPNLKVRAAKDNGMLILNTKAFAGNPNFVIKGSSIPVGVKKLERITSNTGIVASTNRFIYTCNLSHGKK